LLAATAYLSWIVEQCSGRAEAAEATVSTVIVQQMVANRTNIAAEYIVYVRATTPD
jgi:hypothetical protein